MGWYRGDEVCGAAGVVWCARAERGGGVMGVAWAGAGVWRVELAAVSGCQVRSSCAGCCLDRFMLRVVPTDRLPSGC